jgi:ankyrin repeat protein/beta-lactamase regulating signal transducer with metallopeptidase domain
MIRESLLQDLSLWSCLWQSTMFIALGLSAGYFLRRRPSRAYQVLFFAMVGAAVLPLMSGVVKHFNLGVFAVKAPELPQVMMLEESIASPFEQSGDIPDLVVPAAAPLAPSDSAFTEMSDPEYSIPWRTVVVYGWMTATLALLVRLAVTFIYGTYLVRHAQRSGCERIQQAVDIVTSKLGLPCGLQVRSSKHVRSPIVWCWSRPSILLVHNICMDPKIDWAGVVAHELAHCKRWDHITGLMAELTVCLLPWNPLMWLSKKCLIRLGEQACDDWVVATGQPTEDYAESLLRFRPQRQMAFLPAVVHSKKGLAGRVDRILKDSCSNPRTGAVWALAVSIVLACIAVGTACAQTRSAKTETASEHKEKPTKSLHKAAIDGDIDQIRLHVLIGSGVNATDKGGRTALHYAASENHTEIARVLIDQGAKVNTKDVKGNTPLHFAAQQDKTETAELLIVKGADINAKDEKGRTPISRALLSDGGWRKMVELLVSRGAKVSDIHLAVHRGNLDKVRNILKEGTNVDARDEVGHTLLHYAANAGHMHVVEFLISRAADVNARDEYGVTPLYYAADGGWRNVVEFLIAQGADVNARNQGRSTPLHRAACCGHADVATLLIEKGADVMARDRRDYIPLHAAASRGLVEVAELLISKGNDPDAQDTWGYRPMHYAMKAGQTRMVEVLVANGSDVNFTPKGEYPALHYAVWDEDIEMAKLLVNNGANFNLKDLLEGWTSFRYAVRRGNRELFELFVAKGANASDFHTAAWLGDLNRVKRFVEQGIDVNAKDDQLNWTALHWATFTGQKNIVGFLLIRGAKVNAKGEFSCTPLHYAAGGDERELVELFLAKGAEVNAKGNSDETPLHHAASKGSRDIVALLIANGADVNAESSSGHTALHRAADKGRKEVVEMLLVNGADSEARVRRNGYTPLHYTAYRGMPEMVELLLSKGANIEAGNRWGAKPLHVAVGYDCSRVVKLLLSKGANIQAKDNYGGTPLHRAAREGNRNMAELLLAKGADVSAKDNQGRTPLWHAKDKSHTEIVSLLRKHGVKE